jgi:hypothetical protein
VVVSEPRHQVTPSNPEAPDPVSFAGGVLDPYCHACAFVDSRDEMYRIFDPFVSEGLERGERVSCIFGPEERAGWVRHFRHLGLDLPKLLAQGRCEVRTWSEASDRGGRFDKEAMLRLLDELLGGSRSPRIRVVSEMGWAGWAGDDQRGDDMIEFEARANYLLPNHGHVVICVYDTAKFGGDVIIDILRTHPMALIGGVLQVNPFFVPPAELLAELRSRDRLAADV